MSLNKLIAIRNLEAATLKEDIPTPIKKEKMDREFKIWRTTTICIFSITLLLYITAFVI